MTPGACARIRLGAIRHNFELIRNKAPGCRTLAVIKGNAYGHGMLQSAEVLSDADAFGVARLSEARSLRQAGIEKPLVLLGGALTRAELELAIEYGAAPVVHSETQISLLETHTGKATAAWLKLETGMNRLGIPVDAAADAISRLQNCDAVNDLKVMMHFANADDPADDMSRRQLDTFRRAIAGFSGDISAANSAALFGGGDTLLALAKISESGRLWIRPGIALYGVSPVHGVSAAALGLRAAMQFESRLLSVKALHPGDSVGYGGTWRSDRESVLGIVAAGYGDGYTRFIPSGTPVLVNGRMAPVVGVISMDLTAIDLGPNAPDKAGDGVILWGDGLPVEVVAGHAGTVAYQLVTGVTHREAPVYE